MKIKIELNKYYEGNGLNRCDEKGIVFNSLTLFLDGSFTKNKESKI